MVYKTEKGSNSYKKRSSPGIFRAIQIHARDSPRSNDPPVKKRPDEDYIEYAVRWKNVTSMVQPSITSREENFMFVDTLPSPYYDMLIVNTFMKFGDLIYSVGRIENGIKRGRIVDTGASKKERKRFVPDEHVQAMSGEKRRSHATREEPIKNHPHSSSYAQVPQAGFSSPQKFVRKRDRDSESSCHRGNKRKRAKVYHSLPMSYGELLLVLIQNYGITVIPAKPRRPLYPRGYDVNATCEYHGGVGGHFVRIAWLSKTRFNP